MIDLKTFLLEELAANAAPSPVEADPLRLREGLLEAQLIDVRFEPVVRRVTLLFDLRTALHFRRASVGVLVAREVMTISWLTPSVATDAVAPVVLTSTPRINNGSWSLDLELWQRGSMHIEASRAQFLTGTSSDLAVAPPDFTRSSPAEIARGLPSWETLFELTGIASLVSSAPGGAQAF